MKVNPDENLVTLDEFKKYVEKITHIEGKVDRIERHFKKNSDAIADFASTQNEQTKILDEIHNFLRGSDLNNGDGMVSQFKMMKDDIKRLSDNQIKYNVYFALMGAVLIILSTGVVSLLIKIFTKG